MSLKRRLVSDEEQQASESEQVTEGSVLEPQSLLYIAAVFFVATLGLDRLTQRLSEE